MGKRRNSEVAAVDELKRQIKIATNRKDYKELASLHNQLGNQYRHLGQFEEAVDEHQKEINISKTYNKSDKMGLGIGYRNMGETLTEMKNEVEAIQYITLYFKIATAVGNLVEQQRALITMGRAYLSMSDSEETEQVGAGSQSQQNHKLTPKSALEKAETSFRRAYNLLTENADELASQLNDEKALMQMKCNNCQNLGLVFEAKENHSAAIKWLTKAVEIGNKYLFYDYLAPCYSVLCGIYLKTREAKEALNAAKSAAKAASKVGNVEIETESTLMEAKALFLNDDIGPGKKILKKLRAKVQKKAELHIYMEELDSLLIAAVKVCRAQDSLYILTKEQAEERMKLHEALGDNYSALFNFESAVAHYKKASETAEEIGTSGKKLARLYFSIAECYKDLNNYQGAYKYYMLEMSHNRGNVNEEFKTQTLITVALEKMKKPMEEIIEAHYEAIELAQKTGKLSKEVIARSNFALFLKNIGRGDEADQQNQRVNAIKSENNLSGESEEPDSQPDLLDEDDEIDLDDLSEEDDTDDEAEDDSNRVHGRRRLNRRMNEAGETQLHLAAKKGDLKAVTRLIREGNSVNIRDNAGWTPLHEASNFGHYAVVKKLLQNKADVNHNDGIETEKVTPLHDAAGNGHFEVIKLLLSYGANVLLKDLHGRYPIDSLLAWRETDGQNCSEEELVAYREIREIIKEKMAEGGKPYTAEAEKRSRKRAAKPRATHKETSLLVEKPQDYDCPIPVKIATDDFDLDKEGDGTRAYQNAMKQMRRNRNEAGASVRRSKRAMSPGPRGALIPADLDVHEDWMVPDGEPVPSTSKSHNTSKRKRKSDEYIINENEEGRRRKRSGNRQKQRRKSNQVSDQDDDEPVEMQVDFEGSNSRSSPPLSPDIRDLTNNDDEFQRLFDNDYEPMSIHDDFLPSQCPVPSTVEFGKTKDIPNVIDLDSDDDKDDRENRNSLSRASRYHKSPGKRNMISSSDDEDNETPLSDSQNSRNRLRFSDLASTMKQSPYKNRSKEKPMIQTRLPVKVIPKSKPTRVSDEFRRRRRNSSDSDTEVPPRHSSNLNFSQSTAHAQPVVETRPRKKEVWRLKIYIDRETLLVPVEEDHFEESIDWLAGECAKRYFERHGVKPELTLNTKDGAILCGTDTLSLALGNERELEAKVKKFDLPPLVERYCSACASEATNVDAEIKANLNMCQSSNILNLTDVSLRGKIGVALFTALQRQSSLNSLVLSGCSLFDTGLLDLCKVLPTLSGLQHLDLSMNGITKAGFVQFVNVFTKPSIESDQNIVAAAHASKVPFGITTLILSHNPLGNFIGSHLASLITRLAALKRLEVADCNFTEKLLAWSRNDLTKALTNSRLEEVDISYNNLKDVGLEQLLQNLPARKLRTLNCSSCAANSSLENSEGNHDVIPKSLCTLLSRNEDCCNLTNLILNDCGFNDKSMELILDAFDRLVRLENLELGRNDNLTALSLTNILNRTAERDIPLTRLDLSSNPNIWTSSVLTEEMILNALEKKMGSNKKLSYLKLPTSTFVASNNCPNVELSKLETRMVALMEDYAGSARFSYNKCGSSITYQFDL